jgi:ABC-type multidrug transport system fused ATPase/permease subunit
MLSLFKNHKVLFVFTIFLGLAGAALSIAAAFILEKVLNAVIEGNWELFVVMIWVVVGYIIVLVFVASLSALVEKKLIVSSIRDLRAEVQKGILSRDTEQYRGTNTADYISALTNDVKIIEENILAPLLNAIQYAILFVLAAVALFIYSPIIGGVMLGFLVLMYLLPASLGGSIGKRQEAYSSGLSLFTLKLKDQFMGYEVIRSYRLVDQVKAIFSEQNKKLASSKYAVDKLLAISEGIAQVIAAGSQITTMLVAGFLVLNGHMTAGSLLAILQLSGVFIQPVAVIMQCVPMIQGAKPVLNRLKELSIHLPSAFNGKVEPKFDKEIRFEEVSFGYLEDQPVLNQLNVSFERGKRYVLAGESGCGKSTIARLLGAEFSNYSGAICIDENELHEVDVDQLLTKISTIHQGVFMFDESIKSNIDLHRSYSKEEWARALNISGVDKFLDKTECGLDSPVGESGSNLSGGQRQRIAVARALIERKPILILDEGTSAVDIQTAYDIENALLDVSDLTMITITHSFRPELLRRYDAILFMEQGRIVEFGSYDELISKKGRFSSFQQIEAEVGDN